MLVGYGLARKATTVLEKNLGRIPVRSLYYDQLVIQHVVGQLNFALDILLEVTVSAAMHKRCLISNRCWDPRSGSKNKLRWVLDKLKRTIYGWLAENGLSQLLRVNLQAVLGLLPLLEVSLFWFQYEGAGRSKRVRHCRAFLVANGALRTDNLFRPDAHLLDVHLVIPFADIVLTGATIHRCTRSSSNASCRKSALTALLVKRVGKRGGPWPIVSMLLSSFTCCGKDPCCGTTFGLTGPSTLALPLTTLS